LKEIEASAETTGLIKKSKEAEIQTVHVRLNEKNFSCQLCRLNFCDASIHVAEEAPDSNIYKNGSILSVKPVRCDCCGLNVVH